MISKLGRIMRLGPNRPIGLVALIGLSACSWLPFLAPPIEIGSVQAIGVLDWRRAPDGMNRGRVPPDTEPLMALRVAFETNHSARQHAIDYGVRVWNQASLCREGDFDERRLLRGDTYVHDRDGVIDGYPPSRPGLIEPVHLYVFLQTRRGSLLSDDDPSIWALGHDIQRNPADICFRIRTSDMFGMGTRSHAMVIPYATIRAALDRAGL